MITLIRRHEIDVILARSVIPALLVLVVWCLRVNTGGCG